MKGFFDLKQYDPKGGTGAGALYIFAAGGKLEEKVPFTLEKTTPAAEGAGGAEGAEGAPLRLSAHKTIPPLREAYLGIPLSMLDMRLLELPFEDMEKVRQTLPFELEPLVLKGMDEIVFDSVFLPAEKAGKRKILAAYADKTLLSGLIECLKGAGFEPSVITSPELRGFLARLEEGIPLKEAMPGAGHYITARGDEDEEARISLALRELDSPTLNLRRGELAYVKEKQEFARALKKTYLLAALLGIVLSLNLGVKTYSLKKEAASIERSMRGSFEKLLPSGGDYPGAGAAGLVVKSQIKELEQKKAVLGGVSALELLKKLSQRRVAGVVIREMDIDEEKAILRGEASSLAAVEALKTALEPAQVMETKTSAAELVLFTMRVPL